MIGQEVTVIGPPTILKPILELGKAGLEQLKVLYSKDPQNPDRISGIHLLNFEGTIPADEMKQLVEEYDFSRIIIPISVTQTIQL